MAQQIEVRMCNIIARRHEEFIESTLKQPFRMKFIVIFIVLDRVYSWFPGLLTYINRIVALDAATYELASTFIISLVGLCAFPQMWLSRIIKVIKEWNNSDIKHIVMEVSKHIFVLVVLPVTFACLMHKVNSFFECYFDTNITSSRNHNDLQKERESNPLTTLLRIRIFAPISEELVFRQSLIGFITSRLVNYTAFSKSSDVRRKVPFLKSVIPFVCILLSGTLFGLDHELNFNSIMAGYATFGVILGFAYYVGKGRIIHSILPHMFYNYIHAS